MRKILALIMFISFSSGNAFAGNPSAVQSSESSSAIFEKLLRKYDPAIDSGNTELRQKLDLLVMRSIEREIEKIEESKKVINGNNRYATIIFWIVHTALIIGLAASFLEFWQSFSRRRYGPSQNTELTVKMDELALKSSSIGVVILIVSLLFYFLYLKFVYQIAII